MEQKSNVASEPVMLTDSEVANRWRVSVSIMRQWRTHGTGPAYVKLGGRVRYRLEDVEAYEAASRVETGDAA